MLTYLSTSTYLKTVHGAPKYTSKEASELPWPLEVGKLATLTLTLKLKLKLTLPF